VPTFLTAEGSMVWFIAIDCELFKKVLLLAYWAYRFLLQCGIDDILLPTLEVSSSHYTNFSLAFQDLSSVL